jgi:putative ABC transport system permease protein
VAVNAILLFVAEATGFIPASNFAYFVPGVLAPVVAVVLTTWLASWLGARAVLVVSPIEATGAAREHNLDEAIRHRARNIVAVSLFVLGTGVLLVGVGVGQRDSVGVLIGVFGGAVSFTGVVLGAPLIMPATLRIVGRTLGKSAPARLAAQNAVRYPDRSSRTTVGLVIGVTLVTMFSVAVQTVLTIIDAAKRAQPDVYQGTDQILTITAVIFSIVGGFSALIAAVGMVNNLSLSVLQRTRELGLLRAMGFTASGVRRMIVAESGALTIAAVAVGLVLGTFYGWAGAESMLGSIQGSPGIVAPALPISLVVGLIGGAALLTLVASIAPAQRATRVSPIIALTIE